VGTLWARQAMENRAQAGNPLVAIERVQGPKQASLLLADGAVHGVPDLDGHVSLIGSEGILLLLGVGGRHNGASPLFPLFCVWAGDAPAYLCLHKKREGTAPEAAKVAIAGAQQRH
jgi:hypothetical protein